MSSRTGLRLQLMREQTMQQDQQLPKSSSSSKPVNIRSSGGRTHSSSSGGTSGSSAQAGNSRTSPIIISHPIKFTGNKLVHLPPQIIHVSFII
uniref:Uncharacterized protein n=1 Tax=Plectus sambesii TaxID=2011161 RepID=A0A914W5M4_9BILA